MNELKRLFPAEIYKLENGDEVTVAPVPFGKLTVFSAAVTSIIEKMAASGVNKLEDAADIGRVFSIAIDEVISLMALVLNKERSWFDQISMSDGLGLFSLIVSQNFNERTKKNLSDLLGKITSNLTS